MNKSQGLVLAANLVIIVNLSLLGTYFGIEDNIINGWCFLTGTITGAVLAYLRDD